MSQYCACPLECKTPILVRPGQNANEEVERHIMAEHDGPRHDEPGTGPQAPVYPPPPSRYASHPGTTNSNALTSGSGGGGGSPNNAAPHTPPRERGLTGSPELRYGTSTEAAHRGSPLSPTLSVSPSSPSSSSGYGNNAIFPESPMLKGSGALVTSNIGMLSGGGSSTESTLQDPGRSSNTARSFYPGPMTPLTAASPPNQSTSPSIPGQSAMLPPAIPCVSNVCQPVQSGTVPNPSSRSSLNTKSTSNSQAETKEMENQSRLPAKRTDKPDTQVEQPLPKRSNAVSYANFPYKAAPSDRAIIICKTCNTRVKDKKEFDNHSCPHKVIAYICPNCTPEAIFPSTQCYAAHVKKHKQQTPSVPPTLQPQATNLVTNFASTASSNLLPALPPVQQAPITYAKFSTPSKPLSTQLPPTQNHSTAPTVPPHSPLWTTAQFPCFHCNEVFQDHRSIEAHKRERNHVCDTKWQCRHCGILFEAQQSHAAHIGQVKQETGLNEKDTAMVIKRIEDTLQKISVKLLPPLELIDIKPGAHHLSRSSEKRTIALANSDINPLAVPELQPYQVFPSQVKEAHKFFEMIQGVWKDLPNSCHCLDVLILVPPRNTLFNQTLERARSFEEHITNSEQFHGMRRNLRIRVVKGNKYKDSKNATKEFFDKAERCKDDPEYFFVIIHDECHWGAKCVNKGKKLGRIGSILRDALVMPGNNMLTLQISATAWNQIELLRQSFGSDEKIGTLEKHVHGWTEVGGPGMEYIGRQKLMDLGCIMQSDLICPGKCQELCNELFPDDPFMYNKLVTSSDWPTFVSIMTYAAAFIKRHCEEYSEVVPSERWIQIVDCPHTLYAVRLIQQGHVVAVRLPSNLSRCYGKIISRLLKGLGETRFFCVHDAIDSDHDGSKTLVTEECAVRLAELQGRRKATFRNYQDLNGLPCLLVLVEKARMGDTMPSNFKLFDLRARYLTPKFVFSAFLQDIGRAFKWCKSGTTANACIHVLLNSVAFQYAKDPVTALQNSNGQLDPCLRKTGKKSSSDQPSPLPDPSDQEESPESLAVFFHPNLIWEPSEKSSWKFLEENLSDLSDKLKQRFVISAEPQIGKTGAYLHFIELLVNHFHLPPANPEEEKFYEVLESLKNMDPSELHSKLQAEPETLQNWQLLHRYQDQQFSTLSARERMSAPEHQNVPSTRATNFIKFLCLNGGPLSKLPVCLVADMGCGTCALAKNLAWQPQIQVANYDHSIKTDSDSRFTVQQCNFLHTPSNAGVFDVVVFSMSLSWGGARPEFVQSAIAEAKRILKPNGYVFVADEKNNWCWQRGGVSQAVVDEFTKSGFTLLEDGHKPSPNGRYFYLAVQLKSASGKW
ncbi:hypothetical protein Pelo_3530 [Pelomyxa schiedti]|nr:hypothetical protein Pelo_3530 [Pelomyxa schiedti]